MKEINKPNFNEGSISFWIPALAFPYNDKITHKLFEYSDEKGAILILKDADNKLKCFHVYLGKGRTDVEADVSHLDSNEPHMVVVTWSLPKKELVLYIDGQKSSISTISYA